MEKEVLVAISFRELYGREPDDDSDADAPFATFYKDGTYRVSHWEPKVLCSQWKIDGAILLVKHEGSKKGWVNAGKDKSTQKMIELVSGALLTQLLTGEVGV